MDCRCQVTVLYFYLALLFKIAVLSPRFQALRLRDARVCSMRN